MSNSYLPTALRRTLEKTVKDARIIAEDGARDAIRRLGVADSKAPHHLSDSEKELRRRLRAHARALGDAFDKTDDTQETKHLIEAAAYAHWHRMLFARFLAERGLLRHPEYNVPVSLEDCRELAEAERLTDAWAIAERYAASMLPAVFRIDDPALALELDPVHTQKLHRLVTGLDAEVFKAEDSLGWTYQFWRAAEKDAVNASGVKIGADELPAVTQLFTEPYMVRFLLHNTLGAWWAGKVLAANPMLAQTSTNEAELRAACSLPEYSFDMLRFVRDDQNSHWRPAAGTFSEWPKDVKSITVLDPCCGSGHFLTEALVILAALRQAEEHLPLAEAVAAALRDNLYGLEIDGRCVQIAAFAVALTAWRVGGSQTLPLPQIAWVGAPPPLPKREFKTLAEGDSELEYALEALHDLFQQAPVLGTLLEPSGGDLFEAESMKEIERLLEPMLRKARKAEPESVEGVIAARGMADAAYILHQRYTLVVTNVPYLGINNQCQELADYTKRRFPDGKADLATSMLLRIFGLSSENSTVATVSPQNWLYLGRYKSLRLFLLQNSRFDLFAPLGSRAFEAIGGEVVNTLLSIFSNARPSNEASFYTIDANKGSSASEKEILISNEIPNNIIQFGQISNPDSIITTSDAVSGELLSSFASALSGTSAGDAPRYLRKLWEVDELRPNWEFHQTTVNEVKEFGGKDEIIFWQNERGEMFKVAQEVRHLNHAAQNWLRGKPNWGKLGVVISQMGDLHPTLYTGAIYDCNACAIVPNKVSDLPALWAYAVSGELSLAVRKFDKSLKVTPKNLLKIPFDIDFWSEKAKQLFPDGLPQPFSKDPTQWLFHGHPANSEVGSSLHVALARLCGYRWPVETDPSIDVSDEARAWAAKVGELPPGDNDGLLGVPSVAGEKSLVDRLRTYLAAAYGADWSEELERRLVFEADVALDKKAARDGSLNAWVRDRAFRQHCVLFSQRPFLWQISDGLKDGFSVFIHYHRFDQANLRKLTYTLLGDWLARAKAEDNVLRYEKGRELQQMLEKVLEGEKPFDIFVRWKTLAQQPLGWDPDLDDGVRQNIRPFIKAGLLTHDLSKILKNKDRGNDLSSAPWYPVFKGERRNDHHTSLAEKRSARDAMK